MRRLRKKSKITREEIVADVLFFFVAAFMSLLIVFLFDIHRSFYRWPIFPLHFLFTTPYPYIIFTLFGAILGFFIIKLIIFGIHEEER